MATSGKDLSAYDKSEVPDGQNYAYWDCGLAMER